MILYDRIMKMDSGFIDGTSYEQGFARGKSQAARIAKEADELMAEMAEALEQVWKEADSPWCEVAAASLNKFDKWKESTK